MKTEYVGLWQRIAGFSLDSPGAELPFSTRLAKENDWTSEFGARAIEEYKRFAYLAVAAGHPVSPPDAVDQVWHLHLTYTQNYWKKFCAEILAKPLHHQPTEGGVAESEKFQDGTAGLWRVTGSTLSWSRRETSGLISTNGWRNAAGTLAWTKPQIGSFPGLGWPRTFRLILAGVWSGWPDAGRQ